MTTIVTDGRIIAADRLIGGEGASDPHGICKIHVRGERIFVLAGLFALVMPMVAWWENGKDPTRCPMYDKGDWESWLWVFEGGQLWEVSNMLPFPASTRVPNALGSGRRYALGALVMGATPEEAVNAAIILDKGTGGGVDLYELPEHLQIARAPDFKLVRRKREPRPAPLGKSSKQSAGGLRRAEVLSPERRNEIARDAARARWKDI